MQQHGPVWLPVPRVMMAVKSKDGGQLPVTFETKLAWAKIAFSLARVEHVIILLIGEEINAFSLDDCD